MSWAVAFAVSAAPPACFSAPVLGPASPAAEAAVEPDARADARFAAEWAKLDKAAVQARLEAGAIRFFLENAHPKTGMVRDRAENFIPTPGTNRMSSIAATGFGLAVIANGGVRGLVDRDVAQDYVRRALRFAHDQVPRRKGWFVHFVDWETGERFGTSEFSTIDTIFFVAGALYAARLYPDPEIVRLAGDMYEDLDYTDMLTDGGAIPRKPTMSMAYHTGADFYMPHGGYALGQWAMLDEQLLLLLLGLGHPSHPLPPSAWTALLRHSTVLPGGERLYGAADPLFTHQYSELFVDFRNFHDGLLDYFSNGRLDARFNRDACLKDPKASKSFEQGFWGLSAGEAPSGYAVYWPGYQNGTVCITCAAASAMYLPDVVLSDVQKWLSGPYGRKLWGRYGLIDGLNLDQNWFSPTVLGINLGPMYLSLANMSDRTSIWSEFNKIPEVRRGLEIAAKAEPPSLPRAGAMKLECDSSVPSDLHWTAKAATLRVDTGEQKAVLLGPDGNEKTIYDRQTWCARKLADDPRRVRCSFETRADAPLTYSSTDLWCEEPEPSGATRMLTGGNVHVGFKAGAGQFHCHNRTTDGLALVLSKCRAVSGF